VASRDAITKTMTGTFQGKGVTGELVEIKISGKSTGQWHTLPETHSGQGKKLMPYSQKPLSLFFY
jgi:hypothetical protein